MVKILCEIKIKGLAVEGLAVGASPAV